MHYLRSLILVSILILGNGVNAKAQEPVIVTYWRPAFDVERDATMRMIEDFERQYPRIKINMVPTSSYEEKIKTALAGGVGPDIMAVDGPLIAFYAYQGALIPLDDYYTQANLSDFIPATLEEITWDQHVWTGPLNNSSIAVYYNTEMFERAGVTPPREIEDAWTWETFAANVSSVSSANTTGGRSPQGLLFGVGINEFATYAEMPWLWQTDGGVLRPDGMQASGYLDSPASVRGLTVFQDLYRRHKIVSVEEITEGFPSGKAASTITGPWNIQFYQELYPDLKFGIMPLPRDIKQVTPCGSWHMAITSQSKYPDEAWLFIDWMTGVEGSKNWYQATNNLPARHSTYRAFPDLEEYPMSIFSDQVRYTARPRPVTPVYPVVTDAVAQAFQSAAYGEPPREVLERAAIRIDEELAFESLAARGMQFPSIIRYALIILIISGVVIAAVSMVKIIRKNAVALRRSEMIWGYALIAPAIGGILVFTVIPMVVALYLSFHHPYVFRPDQSMAFVGLANYRHLLSDPLFWQSLMNSGYFALVVVPVQTATALGLALLIREKIKGITLFRSAFFVPVVTSMVVVAIIWKLLYNVDAGIINGLLTQLGLPKQLFLASTSQAMPAIMAMSVWKSCGFFMLIFLAGLQAIPDQLYEAAIVDGASRWQRFRHVTLPMLNQSMLFVLVITSIDAMKLFAPIFVMTNGGPLNSTNVVVYYIYKAMFLFLKVGYASAMAFVLFGIILLLTLVQMRLLKRESLY
ncbi:MAG: extracellular solute-binding protein [Candidatus Latescibacteria bacterium]|jgi:fructooligosaccharide transport system substrate-binding protein|nr:extracellular solute-binding protein [Candidatus Latescibacterota bacterium]